MDSPPETSAPRRARNDAAKLARRRHLLDTAERLFVEGGGELPSAGAIAQAAGLAKGTAYLYFASLEDMFLTLLSEHFVRWMRQLRDLADAAPAPLTPEALAAAQARYPVEHPVLMRLAAISHAQLERRGAEAAVRSFKAALAGELAELGAFLEQRLPGLPPGAGAPAAVASYAVVMGLWQVAEPPPAAAEALADPAFAMMRLDFATELPRMLAAHWRDRVGAGL
ncbi:MAG TPA: TetR family transcriptional regulator [Azospirillaceae bacterium]|nr:TetR family transcriptional regulator [Azospirillaceae bacterium]